MLKITIFIIFAYFLAVKQVSAQSIERSRVIDVYADEHLKIAGGQSTLYYGKEQMAHPRGTTHPYLEDEQYAKARLSYNRIVYPEVMLRLDLNRDELVILSPDFRNIVLSPQNFNYAELHGKRIIYFRSDNFTGSPATGFYSLLHSGECKVLKKQTAKWTENSRNAREFHFVQSSRFFLFYNDAYYNIRNRRGLLKIMQPYKNELKQFISANRLHFKRDADKFIAETVKEYEKLSGL